MKDRTYESSTSEDEVCCIIGQAVIELSTEQQPVTKSTLALKLLSMAARDSADEHNAHPAAGLSPPPRQMIIRRRLAGQRANITILPSKIMTRPGMALACHSYPS